MSALVAGMLIAAGIMLASVVVAMGLAVVADWLLRKMGV